jgi:RNA polymerase sigma-70 factor (ECF subfamily)
VLGLISSLGNFRGDCSVAHFGHQVALRRALHARRHFKTRAKIGDQELEAEKHADPGDESPLTVAISCERRRVVHSLLDDLSEPTAEAMALHFMLGYTVSEIATALAVSPDTIWSRLKSGKRALRKALSEDDRLNELLHGRTS